MNKKLGLPSAIAVTVGLIVASSCLLALGTGIGLAGRGFIISSREPKNILMLIPSVSP